MFTLNSINNPNPEFTNKPPIIVPIAIIFSKYISVRITELAQFGISPIKHAINAPITGMSDIMLAIFSSPIKNNKILIAKLIINMYINT